MKISSSPQLRNLIRSLNLLLIVIIAALVSTSSVKSQSLPGDAERNCMATSGSVFPINTWFVGNTVTRNGVVRPADSLGFLDRPNCGFYQWSERMFLWLTSPAPAAYGGGSRVFNSPIFYGVSAPDFRGNRTFIRQEPGVLVVSALRDAQVGPHGFSMIMAKGGTLFEVVPPPVARSGRQLISDDTGKAIEIMRVTLANDGKPAFFDPKGKRIAKPRPILPQHLGKGPVIQGFFDPNRGTTTFLNPAGIVVNVEQGQSQNGVLQAQNGSLVYYTIVVNDVYAFFLTALKRGDIPSPDGQINHAEFPTNRSALTAITDYAAAHGTTIPEPGALAVEVKMSWVEAASLPNPNSYITMNAMVPIYDRSVSDLWVRTGQHMVRLALVGMHVVGSAAGHPEMIWATFEHFGNSPNERYSYITTASSRRGVLQDRGGSWLFSETKAAGLFNEVHMSSEPPNIRAAPAFDISPSNTMRMHPFGSAGAEATKNSEVISINRDVIESLVDGDVRRNYLMIGATWTIGGGPPEEGRVAGTTFLSNTTMETYQQTQGCLGCHATNKVTVSHIFCSPRDERCVEGLRPLF